MMATVADETMTTRQVVEAFFTDWETGFVEAFDRWMHPEAIWQNTGFPDAVGIDAIRERLDIYMQVSAMPYGRVEMISSAEAPDGTFLTERIDHLWSDDGKAHSAHIMGAFETRDGLISRYSDYFDSAQFK